MKILVMDDEYIALEGMITQISAVVPNADVTGFRHTDEALLFARTRRPDIAFLDIEMRDLSGIQLAEQLQELNPKINIIFTTGYEQYMKDAFGLRASGYLLKPVTTEMIEEELKKLRYPVSRRGEHRVRVKTFGSFEVFLDEKPVHFQYNKSKELFAYLVDRQGTLCKLTEVSAVLFPDDTARHGSYIRNLCSDLISSFEDEGCGDVIARQRGVIGILPENIDCDYYDWLDGASLEDLGFTGEYMAQYEWAEDTNAHLMRYL